MPRPARAPRAAAIRPARLPFLRYSAICALAIGAGIPVSTVHAQASRPTSRVERVLSTEDGWSIYVSYYPAHGEKENVTKEAPVVVLLHGDKNSRLIWEGERGLAPQLQHEGYAVIAVDLRKHGQSTNVARVAGDRNEDGAHVRGEDYENMVLQDMEAVKKFIYEEHQAKRLNMRKMAIVGSESSAAVAVCFAVNDWGKVPFDDAASDEQKTPRGQDVRALVLISPPLHTKGLDNSEMLSRVRNPDWDIAILTMYGKLNKLDARDCPAVYKKVGGTTKANEDRMYRVAFNVPVRGDDLLHKREIEAEPAILNFLKRHLADLKESEWRNRQSRLTRK